MIKYIKAAITTCPQLLLAYALYSTGSMMLVMYMSANAVIACKGLYLEHLYADQRSAVLAVALYMEHHSYDVSLAVSLLWGCPGHRVNSPYYYTK